MGYSVLSITFEVLENQNVNGRDQSRTRRNRIRTTRVNNPLRKLLDSSFHFLDSDQVLLEKNETI